MSGEEQPVEVCDHRPPHWCAGCRAPHDEDEPRSGPPAQFSTHLRRGNLR